MKLSNIFVAIILILVSITAEAQSERSRMSSEEWMKMITANAVTKPGQAVHPGYALYFSQVGDIKVPSLLMYRLLIAQLRLRLWWCFFMVLS